MCELMSTSLAERKSRNHKVHSNEKICCDFLATRMHRCSPRKVTDEEGLQKSGRWKLSAFRMETSSLRNNE